MSHFKEKKIQEPSLHIYDNIYGSSLAALSDAWASVAEAKKELKNVDSRIRQSSINPVSHPMSWHPHKSIKDNPITEKIYHKENIPPMSYPQPVYVEPYNVSDFLESPAVYASRNRQYPNVEPQKVYNLHNLELEENDKTISNSLAGKYLLTKQSKSVALRRLKEKINQQKQINLSSFDDSNENIPSKLHHEEADAVRVSEQPDSLKVITRKVGPAPSAPVYKGFNEPLSVNHIASKEFRKKTQKEVVKKLSPKSASGLIKKKNKGKPHRVVAPKKSPNTITTMSWRLGQEIQRKVRQEFNSVKENQISFEQTNSIKTVSVTHELQKKSTDQEGFLHSSNEFPISGEITTNHNYEGSDIKKNDEDNTLKEQSIDSDVEDGKMMVDKDISELLESKVLSKTAKEVLENVQHIEKVPNSPPKKKHITACIDTGLKRSQQKKIAEKSPPVKRKLEEDIYPKRKIRHYDQEEVQKYMQMQQAQRKKQILDEKRKEKEKKEIQEKMLQDLYAKQKAAVKVEAKHAISETFIKNKQRKLETMLQNEQEKYKSSIQTSSSNSTDASSFTVPKQTSSPRSKGSLDMVSQCMSLVDDVKESVPICEFPTNVLSMKSEDGDVVWKMNDLYTDLEKSKADRIAAIRTTAAALRQRLDEEAKRLTSLVQKKSKSENSPMQTILNGYEDNNLPGVHNLDEKTKLNKKKHDREVAAKKIQAAYRGHYVRQSLSWQLPSGRTLYQSLEEARQRAFLNDIKNQPVQLTSTNFPPVAIASNYDLYSSSLSKKDSTSSFINEALQSSNAAVQSDNLKSSSRENHSFNKQPVKDPCPSYTTVSSSQSCTDIENNSHSEDQVQKLRSILEKHKDAQSDKYSVINIFTRNYAGLKSQHLFQEITGEPQHHVDYTPLNTEYDSSTLSTHSATIKSTAATATEQSYTDAEQSIFGDKKNSSSKKENESSKTSILPTKSKSSLSQGKDLEISDLSDHSEKLFSPISRPSEPTRTSLIQDVLNDYSSDTGSSIIDDLFTDEINPILTSTRRFPGQKSDKTQESFLRLNINQSRGRMSPNTLERRLRAEINLFDNVGDTLQQVDDMEKIQNIINAQQQSVALAQVLKAKQLTHRQDLEKLSLEAKEKAMVSAKDIDTARLATANASMKALQAMADMKLKSAEDAAENARKLAQVHEKTAAIVLEAANRADQSRINMTEAYKFSVERQLYDVEKVAVAAASAASVAAVNAALEHHKQQLEQLRKQSLAKVSELYSPSNSTSSNTLSKTKTSDASRTITDSLSQTPKSPTKEISRTSSKNNERSKDSIDFIDGATIDSVYSNVNTTSSNVVNVHSKNYGHTSILGSVTSELVAGEESDTEKSQKSIAEELFLNELVSQVLSEKSEVSSTISNKMQTISNDTRRNIDDDEDNDDDGDKSHSNVSFSGHITEESQANVIDEGSIQLEERFYSSLTEDELKNDFRMVLPSENHRRKSLDSKDITTVNEVSSSDEVDTPRIHKWSHRQSKSPFAEEDTFSRFTADMVRQYIQEEEMRAKHQKALLALREKAIIEKTKAEMAFLEMQKKGLKKKGSDDMMPPITKKQRSLLMKLQAEQAEIRRQKETLKVAKHERKSMLNQQKEIQRIRASTQIIWNKLGDFDKSDLSIKEDLRETSKSGDHIKKTLKLDCPTSSSSLDLRPPITNSAIENVLSDREIKKASNVYEVATKKDDLLRDADQSSVSQHLKKLRSITSERYLTEREKKLQSRQEQFSKILERENKLKSWREKIIEEEQKLKADIKRVLNASDAKNIHDKDIDLTTSQILSTQNTSKSSYQSSPFTKQVIIAPVTVSSVLERHSSADNISPISESISFERKSQQTGSHEASSKASTKSISQDSIKDLIVSTSANKSNSSFYDLSIKEDILTAESKTHLITSTKTEEVSTNTGTNKKSNKFAKSSTSSKFLRKDISDHYSNEFFEDSSEYTSKLDNKRIDDESTTEGTSDVSDIEQRLKGLENELQRRRDQLNHLRRKKEKEILRKKEIELKQELQSLEQQIRQEKIAETSPCPVRTQSPRILFPRSNSLETSSSEKAKHSSDKESRRSLNFSEQDKEGKVDQSNSSFKSLQIVALNKDSSEISSKLADSILSKRSIPETVFDAEKSVSENSSIIEKSVSENSNRSNEKTVSESFNKSTKEVKAEENEFYDDIFELSYKSTSYDNSNTQELLSSFSKKLDESLGVKPLETTKSLNNLNDHSTKSDSKSSNLADLSVRHSKSIKEDIKSVVTHSSSSILLKKEVTVSTCGFSLNDRVIVEGRMTGTIMYLGQISTSPLLVAGVKLDEPRGTSNGTFNGHKYFECHHNYGLFMTIEKLKMLDLVPKSFIEENITEKVIDINDFKNSEVHSRISVPKSLIEEDITENVSDITDFKNSETHSRTVTPDIETADELIEPKSHTSHESYKSFNNSGDVVIKSDHSSTGQLSLKADISTESSSSESVHKSKILDRSNEGSRSINLSNSTDFKDPIHNSINTIYIESVNNRSDVKLNLDPHSFDIVHTPKNLGSNLADNITNSLLRSLLSETVNISMGRTKYDEQSVSDKTDTITEFTIKTMLNDAILHMINVERRKKESLKLSTITNNFHSFISEDKSTKHLHIPLPTEEQLHPDISGKIEKLKTVHDQLDALLGDSDSDSDSDEENNNQSPNSIILPPRGFDTDELIMNIPYTEKETIDLVTNALNELEDVSLDKILVIQPSERFLIQTKNDDDRYSVLYRRLIFDVSKSLYHDILQFRHDHTQKQPMLFQVRRKTYSKFTRKTNQLTDEREIRSAICAHVCTIIGLRSGRPSLEKFKRKLPLNLAKKDYVDAILVDELREEEVQWVNYDEDELRVKFQLADAILENLLSEVTTFLSSVNHFQIT